MTWRHGRRMVLAVLLLAGAIGTAATTAQVRTATAEPSASRARENQFGHDIGDDYFLVNYTQYVEYCRSSISESDRMTVVEIGKTAEGRPEYTAIITSPENHGSWRRSRRATAGWRSPRADRRPGTSAGGGRQDGRLDRRRPARDRGAGRAAADRDDLSAEQPNRCRDLRILNDDIMLCTLINPDGMELVSNWYMREPDEKTAIDGGICRASTRSTSATTTTATST